LVVVGPIIGVALAGFLTRWFLRDELVTAETVVIEEQKIV